MLLQKVKTRQTSVKGDTIICLFYPPIPRACYFPTSGHFFFKRVRGHGSFELRAEVVVLTRTRRSHTNGCVSKRWRMEFRNRADNTTSLVLQTHSLSDFNILKTGTSGRSPGAQSKKKSPVSCAVCSDSHPPSPMDEKNSKPSPSTLTPRCAATPVCLYSPREAVLLSGSPGSVCRRSLLRRGGQRPHLLVMPTSGVPAPAESHLSHPQPV